MIRQLFQELKTSIVATLLLTVLVSGVYPVIVWGIAQGIFPAQANGSLLRDKGTVIGSRLIGQRFESTGYFHARPSAAGNGYDAANSGGSNLGPLSRTLADSVRARVDAYRLSNGLPEPEQVPVDAVTASASGLDPEISPANAEYQVRRVAEARRLDPTVVRRLVRENTRSRTFGILGDPGVNVLELNLALDRL